MGVAPSQPHSWSDFTLIFASRYFPNIFSSRVLTCCSVSSLPVAPSTQNLVIPPSLPEIPVLGWQPVSLRSLRTELRLDHQTKVYTCFLPKPSAKEIISSKWKVIKGEAIIIKQHSIRCSRSKKNNKSPSTGKRNNSLL